MVHFRFRIPVMVESVPRDQLRPSGVRTLSVLVSAHSDAMVQTSAQLPAWASPDVAQREPSAHFPCEEQPDVTAASSSCEPVWPPVAPRRFLRAMERAVPLSVWLPYSRSCELRVLYSRLTGSPLPYSRSCELQLPYSRLTGSPLNSRGPPLHPCR
jgi:hypothetical protein